ncbi:putative adenylate kinase 2 [Planktothrix sp. PCC 11201]|uniref:adenylate kinase family protein n=1 Tax=Planktothrix sp. PCC 11201 TaxID=1729650 RepID=UPI00091BCD4D|nr:nucleoside monophosphate kinase [Planktothrix sp. PCC 11201]SKB15729.1 putative adenylate kinase 2 [Planktothrix sp. PCC 11201]
MRLVILGGPGAGKGTQAKLLCSDLGIPCLDMGQILRQRIISDTELGQQAKPYVEKGELVPDEIMIQFVRQQLLDPNVGQGWLLDGYPRTAFQAEELDFLLEDLEQKLNWAIYFNVPEMVLKRRSLARSRADDQLGIIERRIELFYQRTVPILEYYELTNRLLDINGEQSPEQIYQEICQRLK